MWEAKQKLKTEFLENAGVSCEKIVCLFLAYRVLLFLTRICFEISIELQIDSAKSWAGHAKSLAFCACFCLKVHARAEKFR